MDGSAMFKVAGKNERHNQINVTHSKPEVELPLTFSSILAIL